MITFFMIGFLLFFLMIAGRYLYILVTGESNGVLLTDWASELRETAITLPSERGKIYDHNGMTLAYNRPTYRVYAIIDPDYSVSEKEPMHVTDPDKTAEQLAPLLDIDRKEIVEKLKSGQKEKRFQVEFGNKGKNLPQEVMEEIVALNLPGINFTEDSIRYYPNGMFASHIIGFARNTDEDEIAGIAGMEKEKNSILSGTDGYIRYHRDKYNKKLLNANEVVKQPENGKDIFLTIDQKIQTILEDVMSQVDEQYKPKRITAVVMNAKTGEILAMSNRPSYNPNSPDAVKNWYNDVVSTPVEPGSTMKIFTWAAAIEEGVYHGKDTYHSGKYVVNQKVEPINDHNNGRGWGTITYDEGFKRSSNVAASKIVWEKLGTEKFLDYIKKFDLDKETEIDLPNEVAGRVLYDWPSEKLRASFGQGSTVTPIQQLKAATAIVNGGDMLQPYVIQKVIDPDTGETMEENKPKVVGNPISKKTSQQMIELLDSVVNKEGGTGRNYQLDDYSVIGKTGTAQIPNPDGSGYLKGDENNMYAFLGMAPKDDPQIMMHVSVTQPTLKQGEVGSEPVSFIFKNVMENGLHYLDIEPDKESIIDPIESATFPDVIDKDTSKVKETLNHAGIEATFVGKGKKVVDANLKEGSRVFPTQKVIIMTDQPTLPDMKGWSERDVLGLANLLDIEIKVKGNGYVVNQSEKKGTKIKEKMSLEVELALPKQKEKPKNQKKK